MPTKLDEVREKLDAKRLELHNIFEEAGEDLDLSKVKSFEGKDDISRRTEIKKRNDELTELGKEFDALREIADAAQNVKNVDERLKQPVNRAPKGGGNTELIVPPKGLRQLLEESASYKAFREAGGKGTAVIEVSEAELKTLMTLSTINNPASRAPGIVGPPEEERTVRDLILQGTTDNNALTYMEETTTTNNASTVAEGAPKPESALAFTERTDNVRKIATWIPATSELLADVSGIESYIRSRLSFFVKRTEETQLLLGDGVAPNILGMELRTGVQTQAKGADPVPDAVYKGMVLIMANAFADPTSVVFNPLDWQDIRLLRTADGVYIWGSPSDAGPERIWGLPIRITTAQTQNTAFLISRPHAQVFQREGITITISTEHSDYFVQNKVAILAEERLALAVYRPSAFCKVTGI
jgi:HK97 family phage major capsid protein